MVGTSLNSLNLRIMAFLFRYLLKKNMSDAHIRICTFYLSHITNISNMLIFINSAQTVQFITIFIYLNSDVITFTGNWKSRLLIFIRLDSDLEYMYVSTCTFRNILKSCGRISTSYFKEMCVRTLSSYVRKQKNRQLRVLPRKLKQHHGNY